MIRILVVAVLATLVGCSTSERVTETRETTSTPEEHLISPDSVLIRSVYPDTMLDGWVPFQPGEGWYPYSTPDSMPVVRTAPAGKLHYMGEVEGGRVDLTVDISTFELSGYVIPDTVRFTDWDTVKTVVTQTVVQELDFFQRVLGYAKTVAVSILIIAGGLFLFKLFGLFK